MSVGHSDGRTPAVYLKPNLVGNVGDQAPGMVLPQEVP